MTLLSIVLIGLTGCKNTQENADIKSDTNSSQTWVGSMKSFQASLKELTPFIFSEEEFIDQRNDERLKKQIRDLANQTKTLNHNPTLEHRDPTIRFVATQFNEDVDRAAQSFLEGKKNFSRYQLMKVSSYCVECHTTDQGGVQKNVYQHAPFYNALKVGEKAEYLIANRDFDAAYDVLLKDLQTGSNLQALSTDRHLRLLLMISVRFKNDYEKTEKILAILKRMKNLPPFLKQNLEKWDMSMVAWRQHKKINIELKTVQKIIEHANSEIDYMRSLNVLNQLFKKGLAGDEESLALYLAGKSYEQLNDISPMEIHENYYKACILNQPGSEIAKKCYKTLEESVMVSYTGSSGVHVPVDVEIWLKDLQKKSESK